MDLDDLPDGWSAWRFGDALTIRKGSVDPARFPDEQFHLFSIPAHDAGAGPEVTNGRDIGSAKTSVQCGDCLFSKLNPRIPRTWVVPAFAGFRQVASTEFWPIHSSFQSGEQGYLAPEFLQWLFRYADFLDEFRGDLSGGVQSRQRLKQDVIADTMLPVPPLAEQRRLVARIEGLTARLTQARQARQEAVAEADTLFFKMLGTAFAEESTEDWDEYPANALFAIGSGQVSPLDKQYEHLPYLGPEHIETGTGRIIGERVSVAELKMKSGKHPFNCEDVVYSKIRPALRKVCTPAYDGLCSADMYALRPNLDRISREFLMYLLLAPPFSEYAVDNSDRNAMPKINQQALLAFTFHVPKPPEQGRIVRLLQGVQAKQAELRRLQKETDADLTAFTPAVLAKAFRGEL